MHQPTPHQRIGTAASLQRARRHGAHGPRCALVAQRSGERAALWPARTAELCGQLSGARARWPPLAGGGRSSSSGRSDRSPAPSGQLAPMSIPTTSRAPGAVPLLERFGNHSSSSLSSWRQRPSSAFLRIVGRRNRGLPDYCGRCGENCNDDLWRAHSGRFCVFLCSVSLLIACFSTTRVLCLFIRSRIIHSSLAPRQPRTASRICLYPFPTPCSRSSPWRPQQRRRPPVRARPRSPSGWTLREWGCGHPWRTCSPGRSWT